MTPEQIVAPGRLPLPDRRAHPATRRSDILRAARAGRERARSPTARARRLPRVHHDARLARLLRREAGAAVPRGGRRRLHPDQAQGRRRPRATTCAACALAREAVGPGHPDRGRRQPALGRRRGDRLDRARSRRSTRTGSRSRPAPTTSSATPRSARAIAPDQGRHRRARRQPGDVQAAAAGRRDRRRADRRLPGRPASTRTSRSCCWPPSSACRSARTPAASGLCEMVQHLSMFDFVAVSGTTDGPRHRVRRPPARALHRPGARHRRPLPGAVGARLLRRRCGQQSLRDYEFPHGAVWRRAGRHRHPVSVDPCKARHQTHPRGEP